MACYGRERSHESSYGVLLLASSIEDHHRELTGTCDVSQAIALLFLAVGLVALLLECYIVSCMCDCVLSIPPVE